MNNKMVNRLRLKQTIIKRFVNVESDEEDVEECDQKTSANQSTHSDISSNHSKNEKYTNYKVFVRSCGENVERFVDLSGDNNPFIINDTLDQLMSCRDLNQIATVLSKSSSDMHSNVTKDDNQFKSDAIRKVDDWETQKDPKNDSQFEFKAKELESEGIRYKKKSKVPQSFKCHVCDCKIIGYQLALDHSKSDYHLKRKFGDNLKGTDAMFTIDSEAIGDVKLAITRRKFLKRVSSEDKERYLAHGIRFKNGFGPNAFICSKCNLSFGSLKDMEKHFNSFETQPNICQNNSDNKQKKTMDPNLSKLDQKLYSEGIKANESTDAMKFYCIFCNIYFECKRLALSHINNTRHKKQKRGENLNEIDSRFTIESNRINELEVAFARKVMLKTIPATAKSQFADQLIRLQDGTGCNAFFCQKCQFAIETVDKIEKHINSLTHKM